MNKAYVIAQIKVEDPAVYKTYTAQTPPTIAAFGGRFIARTGQAETLEGDLPNLRLAVLEFPSRQAATDWYNSPAYQDIVGIRHASSKGSLIIVDAVPEGVVPDADVK